MFYEIGLAHALGKEVILITQEEDRLPFDISSLRSIPYDPSRLDPLKADLGRAFGEVSPRF